jgi:hypothetical protein
MPLEPETVRRIDKVLKSQSEAAKTVPLYEYA